ncbi:MAG: chromosome segregation protein SMC, partial [Bdellovibrionales bacterium]
ALGDTLQASLDSGSSKNWVKGALDVKTLPSLPEGLKPLSDIVDAPSELSLALCMVGVAESMEDAEKAFKNIQVGQSIVTTGGDYLRWDGYRMKAEAKDPQSEFLKQKNTLAQLEKVLPEIENKLSDVANKLEKVEESREEVRQSLKSLHSERDTLQKKLKQTQRELRQHIDDKSKNKENVVKTKESLSFNTSRKEELVASLGALEVELQGVLTAMTADGTQANVEALRTKLDEEQSLLNELKVRYEQILAENKRREIRLHAIVDERLNVNNKLIRSTDQVKKYQAREVEAKEKLEGLKERPAEIKEERETILNSITELQNRKDDLQEALNKAETELRETNQALKEAEGLLSSSKESRARAQATLEASEQQIRSVKSSIENQFGMTVEQLLRDNKTLIQNNLSNQSQSLDSLRKKKDGLLLDRERIGPVNLRAEIEAEEIEASLSGMLKEKNELVQAIAELRAGIDKLNGEARDRLALAFERINAYFQSLFVNLFGGGSAHLKLVDSDDPLDAGLEIFAQPPGKSLQSLSLLSGGEQTLTSIALIFAMFLTNPSPICVLDEIDAPLDDANVDRVCDLVQDVAKRGNTRFLIITHHRLTMARMKRLYGVTMAERGVSQLVSVDLQQQLDFLETA